VFHLIIVLLVETSGRSDDSVSSHGTHLTYMRDLRASERRELARAVLTRADNSPDRDILCTNREQYCHAGWLHTVHPYCICT
jgi:hypothetical protein